MKKLIVSMAALCACISFTACGNLFGKKDNDVPELPDDPDTQEPAEDLTPPDNDPFGPNVPDEPATGDVIISFNAAGGAFANGMGTVTVSPDSDGKLDFSAVPRRDGCAFCGWYNGDSPFDPQAQYSESATFIARYKDGGDALVYEALFSTDSTVTVKIDMSDSEWKKLDHDYTVNNKSDIYRMADGVTIGIKSGDTTMYYYYAEVGVRLKGNTSRHRFYGDNGFYAASHFKLSFKQTFDDAADGYTQSELKVWNDPAERKARKNRRLGGMEKIDIKYNFTKDETYSKESYAMKLFNDNGIYAPQVSLCAVSALEKDERYKNLGVYTLHECVDEAFINNHIEQGKNVGDLYKCTWGSGEGASLTNANGTIGVENTAEYLFYTYDKKTNKKKDHAKLEALIANLNNYDSNISDVFDTDYFARFEAVNYILGNPDCIRNHYNNYYIYFRMSDDKAIFIPFDYDRCLGITNGWDPSGHAMTDYAPYRRSTTVNNEEQQNPLYRRLIMKGAPSGEGSVLQKYRGYLLELAQSDALTANAFNAYKNNFKTKYSKYVSGAIGGESSNDLAFDGDGTGNWSFADYMTAKLQTTFNNIDNYNV